MKGNWAQRTHDRIHDIYIEFTSATGNLPSRSLSENHKALLKRMLRKSYPFGVRKHFPYKVWCREIRRCEDWLDGKRPMGKPADEHPGQGVLFPEV